MPDEMISLEVEQARSSELLQKLGDQFVPLSVAAAITFHHAQGNTRAIVTRQDYDDALNIAAAALSRLVKVYEIKEPKAGRVALGVDLTHQRFARGATELREANQPVARELSVRSEDLKTVLVLVRRAGIPFGLALTDVKRR
jgi:hypothetical protein